MLFSSVRAGRVDLTPNILRLTLESMDTKSKRCSFLVGNSAKRNRERSRGSQLNQKRGLSAPLILFLAREWQSLANKFFAKEDRSMIGSIHRPETHLNAVHTVRSNGLSHEECQCFCAFSFSRETSPSANHLRPFFLPFILSLSYVFSEIAQAKYNPLQSPIHRLFQTAVQSHNESYSHTVVLMNLWDYKSLIQRKCPRLQTQSRVMLRRFN